MISLENKLSNKTSVKEVYPNTQFEPSDEKLYKKNFQRIKKLDEFTNGKTILSKCLVTLNKIIKVMSFFIWPLAKAWDSILLDHNARIQNERNNLKAEIKKTLLTNLEILGADLQRDRRLIINGEKIDRSTIVRFIKENSKETLLKTLREGMKELGFVKEDCGVFAHAEKEIQGDEFNPKAITVSSPNIIQAVFEINRSNDEKTTPEEAIQFIQENSKEVLLEKLGKAMEKEKLFSEKHSMLFKAKEDIKNENFDLKNIKFDPQHIIIAIAMIQALKELNTIKEITDEKRNIVLNNLHQGFHAPIAVRIFKENLKLYNAEVPDARQPYSPTLYIDSNLQIMNVSRNVGLRSLESDEEKRERIDKRLAKLGPYNLELIVDINAGTTTFKMEKVKNEVLV